MGMVYSQYHTGLYIIQESSCLDKSVLVLMWFRMVLTQITTWVKQDSHLDIPTKYQYLTGMTILICSSRFFDAIVEGDYWYHEFTYIPMKVFIVEVLPDRHWCKPSKSYLVDLDMQLETMNMKLMGLRLTTWMAWMAWTRPRILRCLSLRCCLQPLEAMTALWSTPTRRRKSSRKCCRRGMADTLGASKPSLIVCARRGSCLSVHAASWKTGLTATPSGHTLLWELPSYFRQHC